MPKCGMTPEPKTVGGADNTNNTRFNRSRSVLGGPGVDSPVLILAMGKLVGSESPDTNPDVDLEVAGVAPRYARGPLGGCNVL